MEEEAQRILEGEADVTGTAGEASSEDLQTVAVDSVELTRLEQVGRWALEQVAGRVGSEWSVAGGGGGGDCGPYWPVPARNGPPGARSADAAGWASMLDFDFQTESDADVSRLRRAMKHRQAIEPVHQGWVWISSRPSPSICEGAARHQPKAQRGHSKEKRLSPADAGVGAGRGRVCAPLEGLCRPGG